MATGKQDEVLPPPYNDGAPCEYKDGSLAQAVEPPVFTPVAPATGENPYHLREWKFGYFDFFKNLAVCFVTCIVPVVTEYQVAKQTRNRRWANYLVLSCLIIMGLYIASTGVDIMREHRRMEAGPHDHGYHEADYHGDHDEHAFKKEEKKRLEHEHGDDDDDHNGKGGCLLGLKFVISVIIMAVGISRLVILMRVRRQMREEHHLQGTSLEDCCCLWWCSELVLCQMKQELDHIEELARDATSVHGNQPAPHLVVLEGFGDDAMVNSDTEVMIAKGNAVAPPPYEYQQKA